MRTAKAMTLYPSREARRRYLASMIPRDRVIQWAFFGGVFGLSRKFQPPSAQDPPLSQKLCAFLFCSVFKIVLGQLPINLLPIHRDLPILLFLLQRMWRRFRYSGNHSGVTGMGLL